MFQPSGVMDSELLVQWLHKFARWTRSLEDEHKLLLMDCAACHHTQMVYANLPINTTLKLVPPHCTSLIQPVDVFVLGIFKAKYHHLYQAALRCVTV